MKPEPSFSRKTKEHFFSMGFGSQKNAPFESSLENGRIKLPEHPGSVLCLDLVDLMSLPLGPCLGGEQDFSEFRHLAF